MLPYFTDKKVKHVCVEEKEEVMRKLTAELKEKKILEQLKI